MDWQHLTGTAIDFGGTKIAAARLEAGRIVARETAPTLGTGDLTHQIDALADLAATVGWTPGEPVALAVTGRLDAAGMWSAINVDTLTTIDGAPLGAAARKRFGARVIVLNDASASALGEAHFGAGRPYGSIAFVTVSTGIGGGIVLDGLLRRSANGMAGHVGFSTTRHGTSACGSGRWGTVEATASGNAIAAIARARTGDHTLTSRDVFERMRAGEPWASEIVCASAAVVAELFANLDAILGLDAIVLGGGVGLAPGYRELVTRFLDEEPELFRLPILSAELGSDSAFYGALHFALVHGDSGEGRTPRSDMERGPSRGPETTCWKEAE
ncbi:ROK family protein [Pararhizobium mangrovi]|uniref:ROK family protein n=1 Tax=Pararhizobium mangrovi TaxID=2590452 RepID=A0A506U2Q1_9HYPH|nr:ROK family protein [Pararhizobium mangrovi]TPW27551.1 ROK family protein [Pararhizobium mangrovi]